MQIGAYLDLQIRNMGICAHILLHVFEGEGTDRSTRTHPVNNGRIWRSFSAAGGWMGYYPWHSAWKQSSSGKRSDKKRKLSLSLKWNDSPSTKLFVFLDSTRVETLSQRYVPKNREKSAQWLYPLFLLRGTSAIKHFEDKTDIQVKIYLHPLIMLFFVNGLVFCCRS